MFQVCSWPTIFDYNPSSFSYDVNQASYPQYCSLPGAHLPNNAIIYAPDYPDFTNKPCNLTYKMTDSITIMFPELYLDENSKIYLFTDETMRGEPMIPIPLKGIQPGIRIESSGQYLSLQISTISPGYRGIWADFTSN